MLLVYRIWVRFFQVPDVLFKHKINTTLHWLQSSKETSFEAKQLYRLKRNTLPRLTADHRVNIFKGPIDCLGFIFMGFKRKKVFGY